MSSGTPFVELYASQLMVPPWGSHNVKRWLFVLSLRDAFPVPDKPSVPQYGVRAYLDYLNGANEANLEHPDFYYKPYADPQYAFLMVSDHAGAASSAHGLKFGSPSDGFNRMAFTEISLSIPVVRLPLLKSETGERARDEAPADEAPPPTGVVWVQPFVWYNNPSMVFSAREIWGANAEYMQIDQPPMPGAMHLDASYVGVELFSPYAFNELLGTLHLHLKDGAPRDRKELASQNPQLLDLLDQLAGIHGSRKGSDHAGQIEIDALKQFRSAENMNLAIYRALVSSHLKYAKPRDVRYFASTDIAAADFMWSAGMSELLENFLGLAPCPDCPPLPPKPSVLGPLPRRPTLPADCGAPELHSSVRPPPPSQPGKPPHTPCWDLPRLPAKPVLCLSYSTDLTFDKPDTRHVYRLEP